jgi:N-acetylmuramoyl-L-alanine amidase
LVLYKTTMPSVLIETGFLTNPNEEKFLSDTASQTKMAEAMFVAFQKYKNQLEGIDEMTGVKNPTPIVENKNSKTNEVIETKNDKITFRVQIETSDTKIPVNSSRFKNLKVFEYQQDGLYKYTVGEFENDYEKSNNYKNELREQGFKHAFVVAFQHGERISLEKGIKLAKNL